MPKFSYVATDPSGSSVKGVLDAPSAVRAQNDLLGRNLAGVRVRERKSIGQIELTPKKLKPADLMVFSRQMAAFLRAGIPILDSLEMLTSDASNKRLQQMLVEVSDSLRAGSTFADAMAAHSSLFPSYYVGILRSAELTGNLDVVLEQLSGYIERDLETTRAIRSALIYPLVILVMSIGTVLLLVTYVLPKFKGFFKSFHATLPLPTRMLLAVGDFFTAYGVIVIGAALAFVVFLVVYLQMERGKRTRDKVLLKLWMVKDVIRFAVTERFCRILSAMLKAGVPVPEAMTAALEATNNRVYAEALVAARDATMRGEGISRPIAETHLFPSAAEKMLLVGEQSGTLDTQLDATATYCEGERSYRLKRITTLFEPVVIVVMGLIVGFVAIALVSAMYGIFNQVKLK
jgi:type IV pilus assembly protein PilC